MGRFCTGYRTPPNLEFRDQTAEVASKQTALNKKKLAIDFAVNLHIKTDASVSAGIDTEVAAGDPIGKSSIVPRINGPEKFRLFPGDEAVCFFFNDYVLG